MHVVFLTALLVSFVADGLVDVQNVQLGLVEHPMVYNVVSSSFCEKWMYSNAHKEEYFDILIFL